MPLQQQLATVQCPGCGKTLVAGTQRCQFCGSPTGQIPVPAVASIPSRRDSGMSWQEVAYWVLAWLWVAQGVFGVIQALGYVPEIGSFVGPIAAAQLLLGIALLTQNEWAIYIARLLTFLNVIGALLGMVLAFVADSTLEIALRFIFNGFLLALACFQIYIFGTVSD